MKTQLPGWHCCQKTQFKQANRKTKQVKEHTQSIRPNRWKARNGYRQDNATIRITTNKFVTKYKKIKTHELLLVKQDYVTI